MTQVALVTGAAQGLGLSIAEKLFEAGYRVALTDVDEARAISAANTLDPSGEKVIGLGLDVQEKKQFRNALSVLLERWGACEVLVNNAALTPTTPLLEIEPDEFDQVMRVNLRGTFVGSQVFSEHFSERGYGRIINMASLAGQMGGTASGAHYASSKAGILTLTKIFAREFADKKITVNAVAPGPVNVPSIRDKVPADKLANIIENMIPVKAMSSPNFIADMVVMLASPQASTVTGACWDANGGISMR